MVKLMKFMKHTQKKNETGNTTLDFFRVEKHFDGVGRYLPCTVWKHSLWKWLFIGVGQPHIESLSYCHKKNFFDLDSTWKFVELLLFWNWTRCEKLKFNAIYPLIGRNFSNAGVKHCSIFALINWKKFYSSTNIRLQRCLERRHRSHHKWNLTNVTFAYEHREFSTLIHDNNNRRYEIINQIITSPVSQCLVQTIKAAKHQN